MKIRIIALLALVGALMLSLSTCQSPMDDKTYAVSEVPMIDDYLLTQDSLLSEFGEIVKEAGYQGTLHAYGAYTCFAPDNDAVAAWVQTQGYPSWLDMPKEMLVEMVKFHLINDTLATSTFVDGRLASPNGMKRYLTTMTYLDEDNNAYIEVNRQARITSKDNRCDNGIVHRIDNVLTMATKSVYQSMKEDLPAGKYNIFIEAVDNSSYVELLQQPADSSWYTLLVESDSVLNVNGIASFEDLLDSMAVIRPEVIQRQNLCDMYVGYHILPSLNYLTDLRTAGGSKMTCVKDNVVTITLNGLNVILNRFTADEANYDPGINIDTKSFYTDYTCANGVIHELSGYMPPRKRKASPVYWDLAEQPEIMALKGFRQTGTSVLFKQGELSEVTFEAKSSGKGITYACDQQFGDKFQYVHYDHLSFGVNPNELLWVEFKTPLLIEGEYNVWVCWRRTDENTTFRSYFIQEGYEMQQFPNVFDMYQYLPTGKTTSQMLAEGLKYYVGKRPMDVQGRVFVSKMLGTIKVQTTGRHALRFEGLSGKGTHYWDMIHFIPKNQDQLWPRFDVGGNQIWIDTPCDSIMPYIEDCYNEGEKTAN